MIEIEDTSMATGENRVAGEGQPLLAAISHDGHENSGPQKSKLVLQIKARSRSPAKPSIDSPPNREPRPMDGAERGATLARSSSMKGTGFQSGKGIGIRSRDARIGGDSSKSSEQKETDPRMAVLRERLQELFENRVADIRTAEVRESERFRRNCSEAEMLLSVQHGRGKAELAMEAAQLEQCIVAFEQQKAMDLRQFQECAQGFTQSELIAFHERDQVRLLELHSERQRDEQRYEKAMLELRLREKELMNEVEMRAQHFSMIDLVRENSYRSEWERQERS